MAVRYSSNEWDTYNNNLPDSLTDYIVSYGIRYVYTSDNERDSYQTYSREVVESLREETDTLGNVTEIPIYETIEATVKTTTYQYLVQAEAALSIKSLSNNETAFFRTYNDNQQEEITLNFRDSGNEEAIPDNINIETFSIINYDYGSLIDVAFGNLGQQVSSAFQNGSIR